MYEGAPGLFKRVVTRRQVIIYRLCVCVWGGGGGGGGGGERGVRGGGGGAGIKVDRMVLRWGQKGDQSSPTEYKRGLG